MADHHWNSFEVKSVSFTPSTNNLAAWLPTNHRSTNIPVPNHESWRARYGYTTAQQCFQWSKRYELLLTTIRKRPFQVSWTVFHELFTEFGYHKARKNDYNKNFPFFISFSWDFHQEFHWQTCAWRGIRFLSVTFVVVVFVRAFWNGQKDNVVVERSSNSSSNRETRRVTFRGILVERNMTMRSRWVRECRWRIKKHWCIIGAGEGVKQLTIDTRIKMENKSCFVL